MYGVGLKSIPSVSDFSPIILFPKPQIIVNKNVLNASCIYVYVTIYMIYMPTVSGRGRKRRFYRPDYNTDGGAGRHRGRDLAGQNKDV